MQGVEKCVENIVDNCGISTQGAAAGGQCVDINRVMV